MSFWIELKRRNVVKVGLAYAVVAWLLIQMITTVMPTFNAPEWVAQTITFLLILLLPFVLVFAWVFELTPEGLKKTADVPAEHSTTHATSQRLTYVITALLVVAITFMVIDRYFLAGAIAPHQAQAATDLAPPVAASVATSSPTVADSQVLPNSVAVIPFANLSPREEDGYFAAGIHDEILNQLVKLNSLNVIARTTVLQYAGTTKTIQEIGRELGVEAVMEGSVRYADGRVLVTAQLIDAQTNVHRWSDTYEREFANIFAIQADIAMSVANALEAEFTPAEQARVEQLPTSSLEAYELFLAARDQARGGPARTRSALASIDLALALDPNFARAWAMKATTLSTLSQLAAAADYAKMQQQMVDAAARAVELDPNLVEAQAALAAARSRQGEWLAAEEGFRRASKAGTAPTAYLYGIHLFAVGQIAKAHELMTLDRRTDPRNSVQRGFYILGYALLGDTERADEEFVRANAVFGEQWLGGWFMSLGRLRFGEPATLDRIPRAVTPLHNAAREYLSAPADGLEMLRERYATTDDPKTQVSTLLEIGVWSAYFGDAELAFAALERATRVNAQNALQFWLPSMREVRQLPRFKAFMREIGLVDYWRQYGYPMLCRPVGTDDFECS